MMPWAISVHPGAVLSVLSFGLLLGWIFWRWSRKSEDPPAILAIKLILSSILLGAAVYAILRLTPFLGVPLGAVCGILIGILWGRNIGAAIASPLSSLYDGGDEEVELKPFYAIAHAHRKQARYAEAIAEIEKQLDRFPGDVEGLLLLADIRSRHLQDWEGAEAAIELVAGNAALPVVTRAKALQALADAYADYAHDLPRARAVLGWIQERFPGTPEATEAAQRLAHSGGDAWMKERLAPGRLRVTAADPRLGLRDRRVEVPAEDAGDPQMEVEVLQRHLVAHPLDTEARERLAGLYAEALGRLDWAVGEIEKLLAQPHHPPKLQARWLHLLADFQVRCAGDDAAARVALEEVTRRFPGTALAEQAKSRIEHLRLELRARKPTTVIGERPRDTGETP